MTQMFRPWSDEEVATLRRLAPTTDWKRIGQIIGRTHRAVQKKAGDLGVRRATDGVDWTADEIATMSDAYPHMSTPVLAEQLGRSQSSVRAKAYEMRLTKDAAFMYQLRVEQARRAAQARTPAAFMQGRAGRFDGEGAYSATQDAVRHLQRMAPIWRCDKQGKFDLKGNYWHFRGAVMDAAAVEARASRAGWTLPAAMIARGIAA